jgi:2-haloacid dehalogenase
LYRLRGGAILRGSPSPEVRWSAPIPQEGITPRRPTIDAVVFDLGGVLIDWNPRYVYRELFENDEGAMERFLADVCSPEWTARIDAGRPFAEAVAELSAVHPDDAALIRAFHERWPQMAAGPMEPTVTILDELRKSGVRLFALSNWSAETFPLVSGRFPFLEAFEGVLISGEAGFAKPAPEIFEVFLERFGLDAPRCVYVDDHQPNVNAAVALGFDGVRFTDAHDLRILLADRGLLDARAD